MRLAFVALLFISLSAAAQTPSSPPEEKPAPASPELRLAPHPPSVQDGDIDFTYTLPADWQFVPLPTAPTVIVPYPDVVGPPKGDACVKVVLTARRGTPASSVVVTSLPFSCYGQTISPGKLADLGDGAAEGLKQTFTVTDPVLSAYTLGKHTVWIERAKGAPKGHPGDSYTFETACTILTKGAVCWTAMAADAPSLHSFEGAQVSLEGATFSALVPSNAFLPKP